MLKSKSDEVLYLIVVNIVVSFQDKESWDMNTPEKIEAAGKKKEEGNALFKAGKYARASKRYEKVIEYKLNTYSSFILLLSNASSKAFSYCHRL